MPAFYFNGNQTVVNLPLVITVRFCYNCCAVAHRLIPPRYRVV